MSWQAAAWVYTLTRSEKVAAVEPFGGTRREEECTRVSYYENSTSS